MYVHPVKVSVVLTYTNFQLTITRIDQSMAPRPAMSLSWRCLFALLLLSTGEHNLLPPILVVVAAASRSTQGHWLRTVLADLWTEIY